jgi:hypothetical protein
LCQRYYEKSYNVDIAPGALTNVGVETRFAADTSDFNYPNFVYRVTKRVTPSTLTIYSPITGVAGKVRELVPGADISVLIGGEVSMSGGYIYTAAVLTANKRYQFHWTANAEL